MKMNINHAFLIISLLVMGSFLPAQSYAEDWSYEIELYALFANIEGDASVGRVTGADVDVDFGGILDNLELGGMIHFEAHHENGWGLSLDYGFMDLGADITGPVGGVINASVRQGIFEALAVHRNKLTDGHLDYLFGIRWWDINLDVTIDPVVLPGTATANVEEDWFDVIVGVRWLNNINKKWDFVLRGDIGGFGLEADFTANVQAGVHYQMSANWLLDLQYKALWVDYENDNTPGQPGYFAYDTVTHGPLIGVIYKF
jgi:opacity protein-like surface antigen